MSKSIGSKFTPLSLLAFSFPSIIMMVFMSMYTIVDGIFISRYLGSSALSSANIVYPLVNVLEAVGVMLATGGSAVVAKKMGEGKYREARDNFSFFTVIGLAACILFMIAGCVFTTKISYLLGSDDKLLADCDLYLCNIMYFAPAAMLQMLFQVFLVTAGKPGLGLVATIFGGVANAVFDYVFLGVCHMDISGAAFATGIGQMIAAVTGVVYFLFIRGELHFSRFHADWKGLLKACINGSSEMVSNISIAIVTYLYNIIMMKLVGENGVAAITIILYAQFLFNSLYLGFSMGVAPVISYKYGAGCREELRQITNISKCFVLLSSLVITVLSFLMADAVTGIFVKPGEETFTLATKGMSIIAIGFLVSGYNIFSSSYFTALSDGKTSAIISFSRTFLFLVVLLLILPRLLGVNGVWLSIPLAELFSFGVCVYYMKRRRAE